MINPKNFISNVCQKLPLCFLCAFFIYAFIYIFTHPSNAYTFLDFKLYYEAVTNLGKGLNPYTNFTVLPYAYSPFTLCFFKIFSLFDYQKASTVYMLFQIVLLSGLLFIWRRYFLEHAFDWMFVFLIILGFNTAAFICLNTGNICLLEQFGLWLAFIFLMNKRYIIFSLIIILISLFKIQSIFFLTILLVLPPKNKIRLFGCSLLAFLFIIALQFITMPGFTVDFINTALSIVSEKGILSPSAFALSRDTVIFFNALFNTQIPLSFSFIIYLLFILFVLAVTIRFLKKNSLIGSPDKEKYVILFFCIIYCLVCPRFKDYSYVMLILPAYYALTKSTKKSSLLMLLPFILSNRHITVPGLQYLFRFLWEYYPLFLSLLTLSLFYQLKFDEQNEKSILND